MTHDEGGQDPDKCEAPYTRIAKLNTVVNVHKDNSCRQAEAGRLRDARRARVIDAESNEEERRIFEAVFHVRR